MNRILLVEDDQKISEITKLYLNHQGFEVVTAYDAHSAQLELEQSKFCFVIFDVMLPDGDGYQLLRNLREGLYMLSKNATPIDTPALMLTALGQTQHVVKGFTAGADDYMSKPFEPAELVARISAILKRSAHKSRESTTMCMGALEIELTSRVVKSHGVELTLNRREYELLLFFCRNFKKVYSREQLISQIWGMEFDGSDRSVDVCVQRLRSKLKKHKAGLQVTTVWGIGYMMEEIKS
jgi:DNA-binding response OmpR family regulator